MATINQPTTFDYASPSQFRLKIDKIPTVEWFVTTCNVPGVSIGEALFPTPLIDIGLVGDKITYETLDVSFLVDEDLKNYQELHNWITDISFPISHASYASATGVTQTNKDVATFPIKESGGKMNSLPPKPAQDKDLYTDCVLQIWNSKNQAKVELMFKDVFPINLSGLNYNSQEVDVEYLQAMVSFRYLYYEFKSL